jgi:tetratricopeptide (TPR) repeat protein
MVGVLSGCNADKRVYEEAVSLLERGAYDEALERFRAANGYGDSSKHIDELTRYIIPYRDAEGFVLSYEFDKAIEIYTRIHYYESSYELLSLTLSQKADYLLEREEFDGAIEIYSGLGTRHGAEGKVLAATYQKALWLFDGGEFAEAQGIFAELMEEELFDNDELQLYVAYCRAERFVESGNFLNAYRAFSGISGFLDSDDRRDAADLAYWRYCRERNTVASVNNYIIGVPDGLYTAEAQALYAELQTARVLAAFDAAMGDGTVLPLLRFIEEWGGVPHSYDLADKAAARIAEMAVTEYNAAVQAATVPALRAFIEKWEGSPYSADLPAGATARISGLLADRSLSAPLLTNPNGVTQAMLNDFLRDYPGHVDETRVRDLGRGDYMSLINSGAISVRIVGNSIDRTSVSITNTTARNLTVTIPVGAYFASSNANVQNMAVRTPHTVTVPANGSRTVQVNTTCMNIRLDIPNSNNTFSAAAMDANSRLARVLALCNARNVSFEVTQAATWIVTDNASDFTLMNTLTMNGRSVITEAHIRTAREIVRDAG